MDAGGNLNPEFVREWICGEFVQRGIVANSDELVTPVNFTYEPLLSVDLEKLIEDDEVARSFAEDHRDFLQIPPKVDFKLLPRQILTKTYYDADRKQTPAKEFLFKVSWTHVEPNEPAELGEHREILRGTTLVIDLLNRKVRAKLTADTSDSQRRGRDRMLKRLLANGLLALDEHARRPDGSPLDSVIRLDTTSGNLRVSGTASLLHIVA